MLILRRLSYGRDGRCRIAGHRDLLHPISWRAPCKQEGAVLSGWRSQDFAAGAGWKPQDSPAAGAGWPNNTKTIWTPKNLSPDWPLVLTLWSTRPGRSLLDQSKGPKVEIAPGPSGLMHFRTSCQLPLWQNVPVCANSGHSRGSDSSSLQLCNLWTG